MALRVVSTKVSDSEISSTVAIDFPPGLTLDQKNRIKDEAGQLIIDHILTNVGKARSPIKGAGWRALSGDYRKYKRDEGRGTKANLEFSGDMLDALEYVRVPEGVRIQIRGDQAGKADGHNNFSGESELPTRQFLPKEGDEFTGSVAQEIDGIIADEMTTRFRISKRDLSDIASKQDLNRFLISRFPDTSLSEVKNSILISDFLRRVFSNVLEYF